MFTKETREYKPDGRYQLTRKSIFATPEAASTTANFEVQYFEEVPNLLKAITPCNIVVRGPNGRFVKWRNR